MDVLLSDIIQSRPIYERIFAANAPAKVGFRLALVRRKLQPILVEYDQARGKLLNEHATESALVPGQFHFLVDETADEQLVDTQRRDAFNTAIIDLVSARVSVDFYVTLSDLEKVEVELSADDLAAILWLLKEGQEDYDSMLPDEATE